MNGLMCLNVKKVCYAVTTLESRFLDRIAYLFRMVTILFLKAIVCVYNKQKEKILTHMLSFLTSGAVYPFVAYTT